MSTVVECHLDLTSVQSVWRDLNKLAPLDPITGESDYRRRVQVMDELLDSVGAYEAKRQELPEAAPAKVHAFLIESTVSS